MALLCWKTAPFWSWLARHETAGWLILSAFWWLCLEPGWLGPAIAAWASLKAIRQQNSITSDPASTDNEQSFG